VRGEELRSSVLGSEMMSKTDSVLYNQYFTNQSSHGRKPAELISSARWFDGEIIRRARISSPDAAIVDLGCGFGRLLLALKRAGYSNIRGVDLSPEQVGIAASLGLDNVACDDVISYTRQLASASVDVVFALDLLEHLPKDALLELVGEVYRVLKPGGRFVVHVPNGEAIFSGRVLYGDLTHHRAFTQMSIRQLLSMHGLSDIACFEDRPIIHGPASLVRSVAWCFIRACFAFIHAVESGPGSRILLSQNFLATASKKVV